jgi:hypothetical protein
MLGNSQMGELYNVLVNQYVRGSSCSPLTMEPAAVRARTKKLEIIVEKR